MQTETRGQQPRKAPVPQQTLPGGVMLSASVSGAVTSSLLTLLMAECFCVPAGPIFPSHSGCWAKTVFWEEGRPRNLQQEIISLKHHIIRMEAIFNKDQCTDLHQLTAKKVVHITGGEKQLEWEGWREILQAFP